MTLDEELQRIRENLRTIAHRLDNLEKVLQKRERGNDLLSITRSGRAGASLYVHSIDLYERFRRARTAMEDPRLEKDPIGRAIVDSLAYLGTGTVSSVTRHVREARGTASRTTVRKHLLQLEEYGIVERKRTQYHLKEPQGRRRGREDADRPRSG